MHRLQRLHLALGDRRPAARSARRTRPPARSTGAAGIRSGSRRRRTPTTTCSSSAPARPGWSARWCSASAACAACTSSRREDDMGGTMRWIPQLPGLGEWARVVNYRKIQLDKLKNVEFIPSTKLVREGRRRVRRRDRHRRDRLVLGDGRPQRRLARDDRRCRREPRLAGDARPDHGRGQASSPGEQRRRLRQRRLLHGRLAGREARAWRARRSP